MRTYTTVVYAINDEAAFKPIWQQIHSLMLLEKDVPVRAVAIASDNEMLRLQLIEEAGERITDYDFRETVGAIISCADLSKWSWERK